MQVKDKQNIFDLTLQAYGILDEVVRLCIDNSLRLDQIPAYSKEINFTLNIGDRRVKKFTNENNHLFVNEAVSETAALIASDDYYLSPKAGSIFIYK